jgi:hypothetical protein
MTLHPGGFGISMDRADERRLLVLALGMYMLLIEGFELREPVQAEGGKQVPGSRSRKCWSIP